MCSRQRISLLLILCLSIVLGSGCSGKEEDAASSSPPQADGASAPASETQSVPATPDEPEPPFDPELLIGVWTTTVVDVENDMRQELIQTYEGDRFTIDGDFSSSDPAKLTGAWRAYQITGTWKIEGDQLSETAEASSFPFWRIGVTGHAKLEILNGTTLQFVRSGKTMTYTRQ